MVLVVVGMMKVTGLIQAGAVDMIHTHIGWMRKKLDEEEEKEKDFPRFLLSKMSRS